MSVVPQHGEVLLEVEVISYFRDFSAVEAFQEDGIHPAELLLVLDCLTGKAEVVDEHMINHDVHSDIRYSFGVRKLLLCSLRSQVQTSVPMV